MHTIGVAIAVLGIGFVTRELIRNWDDVRLAASDADALALVAAFLIGLSSMGLIGLAWRRCLSVLGVERSAVRTLRSYFIGQLGKYVPGGIWPVVGRAEMARRDDVAPSVAYGSTVLSMGLTYLAAILTALGAVLSGAAGEGNVRWWPVLLLLPAGILALHPLSVRSFLGILRRLSKRDLNIPVPAWGTSVSLLVQHVPSWIGISTATWLVATTVESGPVSLRNLILATSLSWVIGFLAVGVPGGIGVREAIFVATATSLSSSGTAAAVALIARVLFIFVDLSGAGLTSLAGRRVYPPGALRRH